MGVMTEQYISAQEWICATCGGHDRKSCGCAGATATSREIQAKVEKLAAKHAQDRQRAKAYYERKKVSRETPVKNIEESPEASAEARKALYAEEEIGGSVETTAEVGDAEVEDDLTPAGAEQTTVETPQIFRPNLSKKEFEQVKARAGVARLADFLIAALVQSDIETRSAAVNALLNGQHQLHFEAVREAAADLYQQLSKAGR